MIDLSAMYDKIAQQQRAMGGHVDRVAILNLVAARSGLPFSQVQRILGCEPQEMK